MKQPQNVLIYTMKTMMINSHVQIAKVAIFQLACVGYAVTNDLVDGGAARFGKVVVVQWTRIAVALNGR
jgi:hypothetical protein